MSAPGGLFILRIASANDESLDMNRLGTARCLREGRSDRREVKKRRERFWTFRFSHPSPFPYQELLARVHEMSPGHFIVEPEGVANLPVRKAK